MGTLHNDGITLTETDSIADTIPAGSLALYAKTDGESWDVKTAAGVADTLLPQQFKDAIHCYGLGAVFRANTSEGAILSIAGVVSSQYLRHYAFNGIVSGSGAFSVSGVEFAYYANLKAGLWLPQVFGITKTTTTPPFSLMVNNITVDIYNAYNDSGGATNATWTANEFEIEDGGLYEVKLRLQSEPEITNSGAGNNQYLTFTELLLRHEDIRP